MDKLRNTHCAECGAPIQQNETGRPRLYCSVQCKQRVGNRAARRRWKRLAEPTEKRCAHCGRSFIAKSRDRIYCYGNWCAQYAYTKRQAEQRGRKVVSHEVICDGCGKVFIGRYPSARWCSKKCANRYWGLVRSRRRGEAPRTSLYADRQIFERDGWVCQICGQPVNPELPRLDPYGATIDHLVPLSRGGTDELQNVRLAHWMCNRHKAAN